MKYSSYELNAFSDDLLEAFSFFYDTPKENLWRKVDAIIEPLQAGDLVMNLQGDIFRILYISSNTSSPIYHVKELKEGNTIPCQTVFVKITPVIILDEVSQERREKLLSLFSANVNYLYDESMNSYLTAGSIVVFSDSCADYLLSLKPCEHYINS